MESSKPTGRLVVVGDRGDGSWLEGPILPELVGRGREAAPARVVLASIGDDGNQEWIGATCHALARLGVSDVRSLRWIGRDDAESPLSAGLVERATMVVFEGDPARLVQILAETQLDAVIRRRLGDSLVVVGVGAAASALGRAMILDEPIEDDGVSLAQGLGYLAGMILDPWFDGESRPDLLQSALDDRPDAFGVSVEAGTALSVIGDSCEVIGPGSVTIYGISGEGDHVPAFDPWAPRRVLVQGDRVDLRTKKPG